MVTFVMPLTVAPGAGAENESVGADGPVPGLPPPGLVMP